MTYRIERVYFEHEELREILETGLTLEEAQQHCKDPETSSRTCKLPENVDRTEKHGPWFDCYNRE